MIFLLQLGRASLSGIGFHYSDSLLGRQTLLPHRYIKLFYLKNQQTSRKLAQWVIFIFFGFQFGDNFFGSIFAVFFYKLNRAASEHCNDGSDQCKLW